MKLILNVHVEISLVTQIVNQVTILIFSYFHKIFRKNLLKDCGRELKLYYKMRILGNSSISLYISTKFPLKRKKTFILKKSSLFF